MRQCPLPACASRAGGYDVLCRQRIASLASYRPLYQAVLDAELTLMAEVALRLRNQFGAKPRQLRVDGVVVQIPKKLSLIHI